MRSHKQQTKSYKKGIFAPCLLSAALFCGCGRAENVYSSVETDMNVQGENGGTEADMNVQGENGGTEADMNAQGGNSGVGADMNARVESSNEEADASPDEAVIKQTIEEWEELFGAFYIYQDHSAVLTGRTVDNGMVEELFLLDITYTLDQSDLDDPEHYIADMKASYPEDKPDEITLWQDVSGGEGAAWTLFKECGPG